jgi:hypothetical protein
MRLVCGLAIVLLLNLPTEGMVGLQQDPAGAGNSAGQAPAAPVTPAEKAPAEAAPAPEKKASESAAIEKTDAASANPGSVSGTRKRRKRSAPAPDGGPRKVVVREGGAREPAAQIAPGMTPAEAARQRQNAERLLGVTDGQLRQLAGSNLGVRQQETVGQVRNYMDGARSALKEGDVRRANTLAQKALLLADDLVRH